MGTSTQIIIRKMIPQDADAVAEIEKKSFPVPWNRKMFWEEASNENAEYLVAELPDGKIVAYAGVWISFEEAQVMNVAVDPEFRGKGMGREIFAALIEVSKMRGATAITLEVRPSNSVAIKLYESFGLKSVGRRKKYYADNNEDALIMWNTKI